jgi:hypothetical protein
MLQAAPFQHMLPQQAAAQHAVLCFTCAPLPPVMQGNIRGLLGSLQTVLWEGSGWTPIGVGDLLEAGQIRKAWMKANLLVHPDKVRDTDALEVARIAYPHSDALVYPLTPSYPLC